MRTAVGLVTTLALAGILAGCSPHTEMPTPPPDPTATPVFASDEEALAAAEELYGKYIDASNLLGQSGWKDVSVLEPFVRGDALEDERETARDLSGRGYVQVGVSAFDSVVLQHLEDEPPSVTIYVCLDFTAADVVDANGNSIVDGSRPDRLGLEVTMDFQEGDFKISRSDVWSGANFC